MRKTSLLPGIFRKSLKTVLIIPYVILVILLALSLNYLSYRTGKSSVMTIANHVLHQTTISISQQVEKYIFGAKARLNAAFPSKTVPILPIEKNFAQIASRFLNASSVDLDIGDNLYYGTKTGAFVGVKFINDEMANVFLKFKEKEHSRVYSQTTHNDKRSFLYTETTLYDPRSRPWFTPGTTTQKDSWACIYVDFASRSLVATHARRITDSTGEFQGVVATDTLLKQLNQFVQALDISPHGIAFIVDRDGNLIASSTPYPTLKKSGEKQFVQISALKTEDAFLAEVYQQLQLQQEKGLFAKSFNFLSPSRGKVIVSTSFAANDTDLGWLNVVAIPEKDFIGDLKHNIARSTILGLFATIGIIVIGFFILNRVNDDIAILSKATNRVGSGELDYPIDINREDEIGELAQSFKTMQQRLQTDHLTNLPNRYAVERAIELSLQTAQNAAQNSERAHQFALMFIDINNFKLINDHYGHDTGDLTLIEIARRLQNIIGKQDMLARLAGDEFIVLFRKVDSYEELLPIKEKMFEVLCKPLQKDGESIQLHGGSMGIAYYPEDGQTARELLTVADQRMYQHKASMKEKS